uniref:E2 ubiquitin-conjugating enzyme n=1 Tax=Macrostomum lignano TaxID=282301 RepID=A0A1I8GTA6_9PLAT
SQAAMTSIADQRIRREFKEVMTSKEITSHQIRVLPAAESLRELRGEIVGPPDTPYDQGRFQLEIRIPDNYPFSPPIVKFVTRIWHPNISSVTGAICLDILKDQWAAAMTLRTVLLSLQALLACAEPDDPQDAVVASQFRERHDIFLATARHWAAAYANAPDREPELTRKVAALQQMGFSEHECRVALSMHLWNPERAAEHLLSQGCSST